MIPRADLIWKIADSMRGRGEHLDIASLVRQSKDAGISVGVQELLFIMQRFGRRDGEHIVPVDVTDFVARLIEPASVPSINVIRSENHVSDGRVEHEIRK